MAGSYTNVNLSSLPAPDVVEQIDYEVILGQMLADLRSRDPSFNALVESDPAFKILEVAAYRETLLRQRTNEAAKAVMLSFARDADLDQIGANFGVERLELQPADPTTVPPTPAVYEDNDAFRARIQLSPESYTTAGSEGSYVYHAMSADGQVKDAAASSPTPGYVTVYVLSRDGDGEAQPELLDAVAQALNEEMVRPMTDHVTVLSASIVEYAIEAEISVFPGPSAEAVLEAARAAAQAYADNMHRIGYDITLSGIYRALHQSGVQNVNLALPASNIVVGDGQAAYCTAINLTVGGVDV